MSAFLLLAVITQLIALLSVVLFGGFDVSLLGVTISARTPQRLLMQFVVASALLLGISPRARIEGARLMRSPITFAFAATILAMWLSLGPLPNAGDARVSGFGLYGLLYDYVPGFNGVRVPARYAMIAGLFLAIAGRLRLAAVLLFVESRVPGPKPSSSVVAFGIDPDRRRRDPDGDQSDVEPERSHAAGARLFLRAPGQPSPGEGVPPVYARVAALPAGTAITEFPFGDAAWEIRYVYYAAAHWKPITNGYSGSFPPRYKERVARLQRIAKDPEAAWHIAQGLRLDARRRAPKRVRERRGC